MDKELNHPLIDLALEMSGNARDNGYPDHVEALQEFVDRANEEGLNTRPTPNTDQVVEAVNKIEHEIGRGVTAHQVFTKMKHLLASTQPSEKEDTNEIS